MKDKKSMATPPAVAVQHRKSPVNGLAYGESDRASAADASAHQDLSAFALPGLAAEHIDTAEAASTVRPRTGSAGLKSLLKFRHSKKPAAAAASGAACAVAAASSDVAAASSDEQGSATPGGPVTRCSTPSEDEHSPGNRGFKGLLDSFRPRSKSDAASLKNAMLQRRRHQSGQAALASPSQGTAVPMVMPQPAAPQQPATQVLSSASTHMPAAALPDSSQAARPRATSWGARDMVLAKKAVSSSTTVNGTGSATTAMSQLLGGSSGSPRRMTAVEKVKRMELEPYQNHHHLGASFSSHGDYNFSGKALLYRTLPAGESGSEMVSPSHRRAMSVSSVSKRTAFKEGHWFTADCGELEGMEIEDLEEDDPMVFVKFMKAHKCYNLIPTSAKLVIFDTQLSVKKAFFALVYNNVRAALLWDSSKQDYVGMLTISDFILILQKYYKSPNGKMEELEEHQISSWRQALKDHYKPNIVSISPDASVNDAVRMLLDNKVHRLPVIDPLTGNALYIMTHKRILKFLYLFMRNLPTPLYMMQTLAELKIGTYSGLAKISPETSLIEALNTFVSRRVSALPVVAKNGRVVDIYAKFDVINLAADKTYNNLDVPISLALNYRRTGQDVVHSCHLTDTLAVVVEKIVKAGVHRLIVSNENEELVGILSLSDILSRLTVDGTLARVKCSSVTDVIRATVSVAGSNHVTVPPRGVQ